MAVKGLILGWMETAMKLRVCDTREAAIAFAHGFADDSQQSCYVIELQAGWTIYFSDDPEFSNHRPATYIVIEVGS
jgi:hypothetical protein